MYIVLSVRFSHDLERKTGSGKAHRVVEYFLDEGRERSEIKNKKKQKVRCHSA